MQLKLNMVLIYTISSFLPYICSMRLRITNNTIQYKYYVFHRTFVLYSTCNSLYKYVLVFCHLLYIYMPNPHSNFTWYYIGHTYLLNTIYIVKCFVIITINEERGNFVVCIFLSIELSLMKRGSFKVYTIF